MLIKLGRPIARSKDTGIDARAEIIRPGAPPPILYPQCAKCGVPVEAFSVDHVTDQWRISVQVECHGKTSGRHIPHDEALRSRFTGAPVWFFTDSRGK